MSITLRASILLTFLVMFTVGKPVQKQPHPGDPVEGNSPDEKKKEEALGLHYESYLKEVVSVLENDEAFKKKLETANVTDIKSGKIAKYLDLVNHTVRDMLHELKRKEMSRLSQLARIQMKSKSGNDLLRHAMSGGATNFQIPQHLDLGNQHTFEIKDLENLIKKTTSDLEQLEEQKKKDFKEYEMEKKYEEEERLRQLNEEERKKEQERIDELKRKHKDHPKLHHPGSKDQFEEVWDKEDHLEGQDFDPKTFFNLHDIDSDGEWNMEEVDALVERELNKVYDRNNDPSEDDPRERDMDMDKMRADIFEAMDKDKNLRITREEMLAYTGLHGENKDFQKDEGWKTLDEEEPVFDEEDYRNYIRDHHQQPGVVDAPVDHNLQFNSESNLHQQQQFNQQPPQHQQQQYNQQPPQHQQQQYNQQPPQHQQQQFINQQQQQQQFNQQPPQHQQQQPNQGVPPQGDQDLQKQLRDLQAKLDQQKAQQEALKQQQQNLGNQPPNMNNQQQAQGQGH